MKHLFGLMGLIIVTITISGCYQNTTYEVERSIDRPKLDYFENVYVIERKDAIPSTHTPFLEKVGDIVVKGNGTSEKDLKDSAISACRELGGNYLKVNSYSFMFFGNWMLEATAFNLDWGQGRVFEGQLIQTGLTEADLKEVWKKNGFNPYEGIYQSTTAERNYKFKVGFAKGIDDKYYAVYLSGMNGVNSWKEGDVIGVFEEAAYQGVFLGDWVKLDKYSTSAELVFKDSGSFSVTYTPWHYYGSNYGEKTVYNYIRTYPKETAVSESGFASSTGTGFLLSSKGYVVTCAHVIQGANKIFVIDNNRNKTRLSATVAVADANNDLCILKVNGLSLEYGSSLPYGFDDMLNKTGESVFCMGYPLTQAMGNEIKVTNGIISSVTGYKGDVSSYQISAPAQPGNSGGPLFNSSGNVIGVVNSKISQAENVSYAVKTTYLNNLISLLSDDVGIGKINQSSSSLSTLVEKFKPAVYIIEVEY